MDRSVNKNRFIWVMLHLALGLFIGISLVSTILSVSIVMFGMVLIISRKNEHQEAVLFSAYLVGAEVLFRMTGGAVLHELTKYAVMLFLFTGLVVEREKQHINPLFLIYLLLLLVGITFTDVPFPESIRKAIAFNLSGPFLLGIAAMYFYNRKVSLNQVLEILFYMSLPVITMVSYLYFKTPSIQDIVFGTQANFEASGGFGPNQVSTILAIGFFVLVIHFLLNKQFSTYKYLDYFLLMYVFYRTLLTFSRGGLYTVIIALSAFLFFLILYEKNKVYQLFKYSILGIVLLISIGIYTSNITGGMLTNRYLNQNVKGETKGDISTGRIWLFTQELESFYENPFFGIGVGSSKFYRKEISDKEAATHSEMSRLLSEHGFIGLLILILLILIPFYHIKHQSYLARAFLSAFFLIWFLTINHSAMRVALPAFFYGLSVINITNMEEE
ncbi:MAG: O-antigen ligase family protein [Flavobacteriaceae bacterium]|nr:O-antigen ligase family protein [Flavobacteriaceae bacterium]